MTRPLTSQTIRQRFRRAYNERDIPALLALRGRCEGTCPLLHFAIKLAWWDGTRALLDAGMDPNALLGTEHPLTALAFQSRNMEKCKRQSWASQTIEALEMLDDLLQRGAQVNLDKGLAREVTRYFLAALPRLAEAGLDLHQWPEGESALFTWAEGAVHELTGNRETAWNDVWAGLDLLLQAGHDPAAKHEHCGTDLAGYLQLQAEDEPVDGPYALLLHGWNARCEKNVLREALDESGPRLESTRMRL